MTNLKPLARYFYASAFLLPFLWTAVGNPLPLFGDAPAPKAIVNQTSSAATQFAALNKKTHFPLVQN